MAKSIYSTFGTDKALEKEGVRFEVADGIAFTCARSGGANKRYGERMAALFKPHKRALDNGTMDGDLAHKLQVQAFVETCLVDWEGVTDQDGNPLDCTTENAMSVFLDLPDLAEAVMEEADKLSNYRAQEVTDTVKN